MPDAELRAYTRETLLILWRTYCQAGLVADTDEKRRFVAEGLTECLGKLLLIDGTSPNEGGDPVGP